MYDGVRTLFGYDTLNYLNIFNKCLKYRFLNFWHRIAYIYAEDQLTGILRFS